MSRLVTGVLNPDGKNEILHYAIGESLLGGFLLATSAQGLCWLALGEARSTLIPNLQQRFPMAKLVEAEHQLFPVINAVQLWITQVEKPLPIPLDLRGSQFQSDVWRVLQTIPTGETRSYREIAQSVSKPQACRAVAKACASNPLALVIPCHRVIRSDGSLGGYRWGVLKKQQLLQREQAQLS